LTAEPPTQTATDRPNIILILADDMGFADIGCYGSEIRTPNLDALAGNGVRFSQMYNCARCCPTRASLLTGLYPPQAGVGHMVKDRGVGPAYQGYLRHDCVTMAEALKGAGYRTYLSGKWHVGGPYAAHRPDSWMPGDPTHPVPVQRGFDQHYGPLGGATNYFHPTAMVNNDTLIPSGEFGNDYYLTDAISTRARTMIDDAVSHNAPFFLYVAYTAPHWPLHAWEEDTARYQGRYRDGGWDQLRTARHEQLKASGIVDADWPISPRDERAPPWQSVADADWEDRRMAVYVAQVDRMDQGIGRILSRVREHGLGENTIVVFLADNGGCAEFLKEDDTDGHPGCYGVPTPDGRPVHVGNTPRVVPGSDQTFASYDLPWANASNTPFRLYKHWVHEGGIATPMIVYWPGGRLSDHIVHEPCHVIDLMPTLLEVAGATCPGEYRGQPIQPLEGVSLLPLLRDQRFDRGRPLFWEHEGNRAVRDGQQKLVSKHPGRWELYDMQADRTELNDLAEAEPHRVQSMAQQYEQWARRCGVVDWPVGS